MTAATKIRSLTKQQWKSTKALRMTQPRTAECEVADEGEDADEQGGADEDERAVLMKGAQLTMRRVMLLVFTWCRTILL